jgi:hypothetical protein
MFTGSGHATLAAGNARQVAVAHSETVVLSQTGASPAATAACGPSPAWG